MQVLEAIEQWDQADNIKPDGTEIISVRAPLVLEFLIAEVLFMLPHSGCLLVRARNKVMDWGLSN
jgi:hypothetical protein